MFDKLPYFSSQLNRLDDNIKYEYAYDDDDD